jgi:hypothetical protein
VRVTVSRRRVLCRILAGIAAAVLVGGLFLAFGLDRLAHRAIENAVREALGAPVEIRKVRVRWKGKAEIDHARIGNPGGYLEPLALEVSSLDAFLDRGSLFGPEIQIHDMVVVRPTFTVVFQEGRSNVGVLVERLLDAIPADAPWFRIERLRVREAVVRIRSAEIPGGETVFRLPDLELRNFGDSPAPPRRRTSSWPCSFSCWPAARWSRRRSLSPEV